MTNYRTVLSLAVAVALVACSKAPEKAVEKMIESTIQKDGSKAKVDLSGGAAKITTTDASGKTSQIEMGAAKVGEAELGVPFYPGASPAEGSSTKVSTPDGSVYSVFLQSPDSPDKVAAFYRERLKAMSAGKQMMDMSGGDGSANLMLADEKEKTSVQVNVMKGAKGTDVQIVANRPTAK